MYPPSQDSFHRQWGHNRLILGCRTNLRLHLGSYQTARVQPRSPLCLPKHLLQLLKKHAHVFDLIQGTRKKTFAKHERRVSKRERLFPRFWKLETYVGKSKQYQKLFFKCINYKTKVGHRKKAFAYSLLLHLLLIKGSSINSEKID